VSTSRPLARDGRTGRPVRRATRLFLLVCAVGLAGSLAACSGTSEPDAGAGAQGGAGESGPVQAPSDGETLVQERCTDCHPLTQATSWRGDESAWADVVDRMVAKGAQLTPEERRTVILYLAETFP
jgi:cytochrome c5